MAEMTIELSEYVIDAIADAVVKKMQEPKTGHWIPIYQGDEVINYQCSECEVGNTFGKKPYGMNYCPNCGSYNKVKMSEIPTGSESEGI